MYTAPLQTFSTSPPWSSESSLKSTFLSSCLSNLYESLTASLKQKMSLIWHTVMKRGRPNFCIWQWRDARVGESMRGRYMRFEVLLHAYGHLGKEYIRRPSLRIPTCLSSTYCSSPVPAPTASVVPLDILRCFRQLPASTHLKSLFTSSLHLFYIIHLIFRFRFLFGIQNSAVNATNVRRTSPQSEQPSRRLSFPSTMVGRERPRSMTVTAPFPRHSSRISSKDLCRSAPHPHAKNGFTNLTTRRANLTPNSAPKNPSKFSSSTLPSPRHKAPHARINIRSSPHNPVLETTPTHTFFPTLPRLPSCWQMTKQKLLTELPTTYHPNARSLFVRFFIHYLFFQFREQSLLTHPNVPYLFPLLVLHTPSSGSSSSCRPLPRPSIPADCVFKTDNQSSVFSLSLITWT